MTPPAKDTEYKEYMFPVTGSTKEEKETGLRIHGLYSPAMRHLPENPTEEALERSAGW